MKNVLKTHIIEPLRQDPLKYLAFRLVWTQKEHPNVREVWGNMYQFQEQLCNELMGVPGVIFFISAITATRTTSSGDIHPGLAFWLVADPYNIQECQVFTMLRKNIYRAELKLLKYTARVVKCDEKQADSLSMVLKDTGVGYVTQKLAEANGSGSSGGQKERIYLRAGPVGDRYTGVLINAQKWFAHVGVHMSIRTF